MKKFVLSFIIILLSFSLFFVGCSTYNAKNLANDIDISMNNFVNAIYNLDWPSDEDLDTLDNVCYIERDDTAIDDIQKVTDTNIDTTEEYTIRVVAYKGNFESDSAFAYTREIQ